MDIKKICLKYDIQQCHQYLTNPLTKSKWKTLIKKKVRDRINDITRYYSSLKYIEGSYTIGKIHPLLSTNTSCTRDINRIPVRVKIATGTYVLQSNRAKYNSGYVSPLCKLCNENNEELSHFLLYCPILEIERKQLLSQITEQCLVLCNNFNINTVPDLLCVIANPYHLLEHCTFSQCRELCCFINSHIEPALQSINI